ncbi:MAG: S8 family serine peptidase [Actinomycetota bacterium]|nr:S8 family serine peptidase [Actinomycetota bacterium]
MNLISCWRRPLPGRALTAGCAVFGALLATPVPALAASEPTRPWVAVVEHGDSIRVERVDARTAGEAAVRVDRETGGADVLALARDTRARVADAAPDPLRSSQWALDQVPFEAARAEADPSDVVVAVVDTGVDAGHEDLAGIVLPGWDFVTDTPGGGSDPYGHGTHVAGIVAAATGNGRGVAGAAPGVRILPVRVLGDDGYGWTSDIASGIRWAADHGADVINLSLGGTSGASIYRAAVDYAVNTRGAVVLAAAGNEYLEGNPTSYPAADRDAVAVGASNSTRQRASFSNTGTYVDLAAPGTSIIAPCPTAASICGDPSGYRRLSGTSMATPYAAAAAALLRAAAPESTPAQIRTWLESTATDAGAPGHDIEFGAGIVAPLRAMAAARDVPPAPAGLTAVEVAPGTVEVRWDAAAGSDVDGFDVHRNGALAGRVAATNRFFLDTGLAAGTAYSYEVRTVNLAGAAGMPAGPVVIHLSDPAPPAPPAPPVNPAPPAAPEDPADPAPDDPSPGGYWVVGTDGRVGAFGSAARLGDLGGLRLSAPVVAAAVTPTGAGYWLAGADGAVYAFGDAPFLGSMAGRNLNQPVAGLAATRSGNGYWLLGADGGIFSFGDAAFYGSTGGIRLNRPVVDMAPTPSGQGYWLVATDGGVFAFGDAGYFGSTGGITLNRPVTSLAPSEDGGYWLVASDGGIFAFGVPFHGSLPGLGVPTPEGRRIRATSAGDGYYILGIDGSVFAFGAAPAFGHAGLTAVDLLLAP